MTDLKRRIDYSDKLVKANEVCEEIEGILEKYKDPNAKFLPIDYTLLTNNIKIVKKSLMDLYIKF